MRLILDLWLEEEKIKIDLINLKKIYVNINGKNGVIGERKS